MSLSLITQTEGHYSKYPDCVYQKYQGYHKQGVTEALFLIKGDQRHMATEWNSLSDFSFTIKVIIGIIDEI